MNGIAGIVYPDVFQFGDFIVPMLNTMNHRGGNGTHDTYTHKNIQIGICKSQISSNEKKNIFSVADGTLCNAEELHSLLKKSGYQLQTQNPAEIFVYAYELWGPNFIEHVDGDFSIAIFDQQKGRLILYRDRIGKKPLYWYQDPHYFIFASELKALLVTGAIPQTVAVDAISSYLYFGFIPQDMTPIKDVNKLLPGHYLQLEEDRSLIIHSYWSYSSYFEIKQSDQKTSNTMHLNNLIKQAVKKHLPKEQPPSDPSIGCLISGGLGSASIAYYIQQLAAKEQLSAYTVGFLGQNDQDVAAAVQVAHSLKISHHCEVITPETLLDNFVKIAWHLDEPLADPNVIAIWKLAELAKKSNTHTVFSGMGSDELLMGHNRYTTEEKGGYVNHIKKLPFPSFKGFFLHLLRLFYKPASYDIAKISRTIPWQFQYLKQNAIFDEHEIAAAAPKLAGLFDPEIFLHKFHNLARIKSPISSFVYFDIKTRLPDCFILQFERLTAAQGLDWQAPYLDKQIIQYLAGIPEVEHLEESNTAQFLKQILKDIFPQPFLNRPKKTRQYFLTSWIETSELHEIFSELHKGMLVESGFISEQWLFKNTSTPERRASAFKYLWSIFALEIWFRLFIHRSVETTPPDIGIRELLAET
jgi:asparagine synthase (glutamine-hydrolysing)